MLKRDDSEHCFSNEEFNKRSPTLTPLCSVITPLFFLVLNFSTRSKSYFQNWFVQLPASPVKARRATQSPSYKRDFPLFSFPYPRCRVSTLTVSATQAFSVFFFPSLARCLFVDVFFFVILLLIVLQPYTSTRTKHRRPCASLQLRCISFQSVAFLFATLRASRCSFRCVLTRGGGNSVRMTVS